MVKIKMVLYKEPMQLLGRALQIHLKDGGKFYFLCQGAGVDYISGIDDESTNLYIKLEDIDYILGS